MKLMTTRALAAGLLLLAGAAAAIHIWRGAEGETQHPRIADRTGVLAPFGPRLGRMADAFERDLGVDLQVLTLDQRGETIERQADAAFAQRGVGAHAPTGGILVVLNPALARARIEVGYSLEGALPDLHMARIARDQLAPYFAYGAAGMALMDTLRQLRDLLTLAAARGDLALDPRYAAADVAEARRFLSGGAGARAALSSIPDDAHLKRTLNAQERARYAPQREVERSVESFLRATEELAGDPSLELFTDGSRLMRAHYPLAPLEELQRAERIRASMPLEYRVRGDRAVATSRRPARGFVPVLLVREAGLWRVDLVETWKNLFFGGDGNYTLRNATTPYAFGLAEFGEGRPHDLAPIALSRTTTSRALESLAARTDALGALRRGEIWLRNAFVFAPAYAAYRAAQAAEPNDPLILETLAERALYLGFPEIAIPALERIDGGVELRLAKAHDDAGDPEAAAHWTEEALEENPLDLEALAWREYLARGAGRDEEAAEARTQIERLSADAEQPAVPVELSFDPATPSFEPRTTVEVGGTTVYDHGRFGVRMHNRSRREVEIVEVKLYSYGTARDSGLGDITEYWNFPAGGTRLRAGESVRFEKTWGFTEDSGHEHVRYVFRTCWKGPGTPKQCRRQWVDTLPPMNP